MGKFSALRSIALWATVGLACGADGNQDAIVPDANGGHAEAVGSERVCPDCQTRIGGETSDLGGDESDCALFYQRNPVALEDAMGLGFNIDELHAIAAEPIVASFAWRPFTDFIPGDRAWDEGDAPAGFESETSVSISVRLTGTATHGRYVPALCDADGFCRDPSSRLDTQCGQADPRGQLFIDGEVDVRMADGSINASIPLVLSSLPHSGVQAIFSLDLSRVSGTLRLAPRNSGPYQGRLYGQLYLRPGNVRGFLAPEIEPVEPPWLESWLHRPLVGRFPAEDDCRILETPADPDTAAGQAIISQAQDLYRRLQPLMNEASPMPVRWAGSEDAPTAGTSTLLHVEVSSLAEARCGSDDGVLTVSTQAQFGTDDGQFSLATEVLATLHPQSGKEPAGLRLDKNQYLTASDPFWSKTFSRIDLEGSRGAHMHFGASSTERAERPEARAVLWVIASSTCGNSLCDVDNSECARCARPRWVSRFETQP